MKKLTLILALIAAAALVRAEEPAGEKKDGPRGGPQGGYFEMMDADKDGKITAEESAAAQTKMLDQRFSRLDKNSDGSISKDEIPQPPKEGEAGGDRRRFMPDLSAMDKDNNGSVSKDEFAAASKEEGKARFAKMDKNGDGAITKDEAEAVRAQFGGDRRKAPEGDKK